jgi:mannose-6-phosphate isomerase
MDLYPLNFNPVYKEKIWGGTRIKEVFNRDLPADRIGESWEVTAQPGEISTVKNGVLKGEKLTGLIKEFPLEMLGRKTSYFPLLIKYIDANDKLSVQVHPDNDYARRVEGVSGKSEMWYVIKAQPGAKLIYGLKPGTTREVFARSIKDRTIEEYLNEVEVKEGDTFFMPAGTVHAIEEGILIAEIQQNSDITYRIHDWGRTDSNGKPRALHIEKALDVINFNSVFERSGNTGSLLANCPYFVVEKLDILNNFRLVFNKKSFFVLLTINGEGAIYHNDLRYNLTPGITYFLPAALDEITIKGKVLCLLTYLPDA